MTSDRCPFCAPDPGRLIFETDAVRGLWDAFPVSPGHALVVPRRHVATWFEATDAEQLALLAGIDRTRAAIEAAHRPDGFTIGINVGEAAGQTVFHLHVHVIPRYRGDVRDPRGGVRHVIPGKGVYQAGPRTAADRQVIVTGGDDPFRDHLVEQLSRAIRADVAAAFVSQSGLDAVFPHLEELLERGGRLRFLTGDYLDFTDPEALARLCDLAERHGVKVDLRIVETRCNDQETSFHPKAYVLHLPDGGGVAYVGSSNLTRQALTTGIEWNLGQFEARDPAAFAEVAAAFDRLFAGSPVRLDRDWIDRYRARRRPPRVEVDARPEPVEPPPPPHAIQQEALAALEASRQAGHSAGLVVLATGLGKTWLAAFDSCRSEAFRRVLFVAHREEILTQAMETFRRIRPTARLGLFTGTTRAPDADILFASVQTLGRQRHLADFARDAFDYLVVDEFHHAAARTYRNLIDHFRPRFLLGLTATPERTDGGDLLALCQQHLVYRCDLFDGIRRDLLVPFHCFGVPDEVDYANIPWRSGRFDDEALTQAVATQARAANALEQYRKRAGTRTLAFCGSQRHADRVDHPLAAAVRAGAPEGVRQGAAHRHRLHREPPRLPHAAPGPLRARLRRRRDRPPAQPPRAGAG